MGRVDPRPLETAREIVARLRQALRARAVVLFGSRARGDHTQHSDLDLAVVSPGFAGEPRMYRRVMQIQDALLGLGHFDVVGLSPQELEDLDCLLVLDIVHDGQPLYDDGPFARSRRLLSVKVEQGLVERIQGGWRIGTQEGPPSRIGERKALDARQTPR